MSRRLLFIPIGIVSAIVFSALLTVIFALEIYLDEVYDGPLKYYLVALLDAGLRLLGIRTNCNIFVLFPFFHFALQQPL